MRNVVGEMKERRELVPFGTGMTLPELGSIAMNETASLNMSALSVVLIGPHEMRRRAAAEALTGSQAQVVQEVRDYPEIDDLPEILQKDRDVVVIDLQPDPEQALDLLENICAGYPQMTVIAYAAEPEPELLMRCMRAGAREFLSEPLTQTAVTESLVRAAARREDFQRQNKRLAKLLVFVGSKGGAGTTTVASSFAVCLSREAKAKTVLLDLNPMLGDAALSLGVKAKFSIADAVQNLHRLDSELLRGLVTEQKPGLAVLASTDGVLALQPDKGSLERVVGVARETYEYVVVDAGVHAPDVLESLFDSAAGVYLVTQVGVVELRNANRIIQRYFSRGDSSKLQIVLNRFAGRKIEIDDESITKALTRPATWKVPNDYAVTRKAQNTGVPIADEQNAISRAITEMARAVVESDKPPQSPKKKRFGLF